MKKYCMECGKSWIHEERPDCPFCGSRNIA